LNFIRHLQKMVERYIRILYARRVLKSVGSSGVHRPNMWGRVTTGIKTIRLIKEGREMAPNPEKEKNRSKPPQR